MLKDPELRTLANTWQFRFLHPDIYARVSDIVIQLSRRYMRYIASKLPQVYISVEKLQVLLKWLG